MTRRRARAKVARPAAAPSPPRRSRRPRPPTGRRWKALVATLFALTALGLGAFAALLWFYGRRHGPGEGREVELAIPGDESPEALAARLTGAGLIAEPQLFAFYLRATGRARAGVAAVVRGAHLLSDDLSPAAIALRLERSLTVPRVKVTFPEGWNRFDMGRRLQASRVCLARGFAEAGARPELLEELHVPGASVEGFLFPATYEFPTDADPADVVRRMKAEFDKRWATLEQRNASALLDLTTSLGWGAKEIVTLASMVEKEAVVDEERPTVASVFMNRLRDPSFTPKLMQCDPTAAYGCAAVLEAGRASFIPSCAAFTGKVTHDLLQDASNPYNTYKHEGLPPGPIANPGMRSLQAAMSPATTRYLYFVARGEGRHTFSETYAAHTAAIRHTP